MINNKFLTVPYFLWYAHQQATRRKDGVMESFFTVGDQASLTEDFISEDPLTHGDLVIPKSAKVLILECGIRSGSGLEAQVRAHIKDRVHELRIPEEALKLSPDE